MHKAKKIALQLCVGAEVIVFGALYIYGSHGMKSLNALRDEVTVANAQVVSLQEEVTSLEKELNAWQHHPFYKEKIAREQLQMARAGDTIYYLR